MDNDKIVYNYERNDRIFFSSKVSENGGKYKSRVKLLEKEKNRAAAWPFSLDSSSREANDWTIDQGKEYIYIYMKKSCGENWWATASSVRWTTVPYTSLL